MSVDLSWDGFNMRFEDGEWVTVHCSPSRPYYSLRRQRRPRDEHEIFMAAAQVVAQRARVAVLRRHGYGVRRLVAQSEKSRKFSLSVQLMAIIGCGSGPGAGSGTSVSSTSLS